MKTMLSQSLNSCDVATVTPGNAKPVLFAETDSAAEVAVARTAAAAATTPISIMNALIYV